MTQPGRSQPVTVCILGGTGSLGQAIVACLAKYYPHVHVIIISRNESAQHITRTIHPHCEYVLGDIRDSQTLTPIFLRTTHIIHAAAIKHVQYCQDSPMEAFAVNVTGTGHVLSTAMDTGVEACLFISSDKAVYPCNVYGRTKMLGEQWVSQMAKRTQYTQYATLRCGNFADSSGSVIKYLKAHKRDNHKRDNIKNVLIHDPTMTRYYITLSRAAATAAYCVFNIRNGALYMPDMSAYNLLDLAKYYCPDATIETSSIRPNEKYHEHLAWPGENICRVSIQKSRVLTSNIIMPARPITSAEAVLPIEKLLQREERYG